MSSVSYDRKARTTEIFLFIYQLYLARIAISTFEIKMKERPIQIFNSFQISNKKNFVRVDAQNFYCLNLGLQLMNYLCQISHTNTIIFEGLCTKHG